MDKIYSYQHQNREDSIKWAQLHFIEYDGEVSPLWNDDIKTEFARLVERRKQWGKLWEIIGADLELGEI